MNTIVQQILTNGSLGVFDELAMIGEGGFGSVLRARHTLLNRPVALKIPHDQESSYEELLSEGQILASLSHPNIVSVFDAQWVPVSASKDVFVIVTEFMPGGDLSDKIVRPLKEKEALPILTQIASALSAAHNNEILHRDVKLENVLIEKRGSTIQDAQIKLADFGIAEHINDSTSNVAGSPLYMAPEVWLGCPLIPSDVYAWGVLAYFLFSEVYPFLRQTIEQTAEAHFQHVPPMLTQLTDQCEPRIAELVRDALSKDFRERPACGKELYDRVCSISQHRSKRKYPSVKKRNQHLRGDDVPHIVQFNDDILHSRSQAIAYPANTHFSFGGGVSGVLLKACGKKLESAVHNIRDRAAGHSIPVGSAVVTPAFELESQGIRHVIHAATLDWNPFRKKYERAEPRAYLADIANSVESSCKEAEGMPNVDRLALPLFGLRVGKRLYSNLSVDQLIAANIQGLARYRLSLVTKRERRSHTLSSIVLSVFEPSDRHVSAELARSVENQLQLIQPVVGQLIDANAQALIVSANNWLFPGSGNARAISDAAGKSFERELEDASPKEKPLRRGIAVSLLGGRLTDALGNRRLLIHAVTTWYEKRTSSGVRRRAPAAPCDVYKATRAALREAIEHEARSVAVTLMCARPGYHCLNEEEAPATMATIIARAINDMRVELAGHVDRVLFVLPTWELFAQIAPLINLVAGNKCHRN